MPSRESFKSSASFETRKAEARKIRSKYPDMVPLICERARGNVDVPEIDKKKFLVPPDLTMAQFSYVIRKRMKLDSQKAIFLTVGAQQTLPTGHQMISHIYEGHRDEDGFLYVTYSAENTFG